MESRAYNFEIRAEKNEDNIGVITGKPIVYESRTDLGPFDEIIAKGALNETDLKDVRFLVNHDISKVPLARSRNNNANSTMQMTVDDTGMSIRVNLDVENNSDSRNLYSAIERGDITGMSFMFSVVEETWSDVESEHPTRTINKIGTVLEVSAVTFPAYEETEIGVRTKFDTSEALASLDSARRSLDSEKDEVEILKIKNEILGGI